MSPSAGRTESPPAACVGHDLGGLPSTAREDVEGGPGGAYSNISTSCGGPPSSVGDGTYLGLDAKVEVVGKTIVMWTSWASLTKEIRAANTLKAITASTQNAEPLTGIIGLGLLGPGATDTASTDKAWKYA